jgi:hypothetical protein
MKLSAVAAAVVAATVTATLAAQSGPLSVDAAFQKFWDAKSPAEASRQIDAVVKTGVSFDEALRRFRQGRTYGPQKTGVVMTTDKAGGVEHYYAVNVPASYDPAKKYQVRFQLHGGVMGRTTNQPRNSGDIGTLAGPAEQFYVLPYGWFDAPWWSEDQVLNFSTIVDALKRTYNIDENRVAIAGVSDGATGAYYIAMQDTTPYASFLPLNGFIMVLANPDTGIRSQLHPNNIRNKPWFAVNGGRDRLYPIAAVEPYLMHLKKAGVSIDYHPQPEGEHNTAWWPEVKGTFEKFVAEHPRSPHPATLTWETADLAHNRAHWLVIDKLGKTGNDATNMADANDYGPVDPAALPLFERRQRSGRVDLIRSGNTVEATHRGVAELTLLISPDAFDLSQPIKVTANGRVVFDAKVLPSTATLLKWAARDNDRTMLYAAEIPIKLGR